MNLSITISDDHFAALAAGLPGDGTDDERVVAYLEWQITNGIAPQFVKIADDKRFAAVGLPNLKRHGLDEDQVALLIADAMPKHAARLAEAEAAASPKAI